MAILGKYKEAPLVKHEFRLLTKCKHFQTQRRYNSLHLSILNELSDDLTNARTIPKLAEYRQVVAKLSDSETSPKSYWSILKLPMQKPFHLYHIVW